MSERQQEIAQAARERPQRVVAAGLLGFAVTEEVGRDHGEPFRERRQDETPRGRTAGHAVHEHENRAGPSGAIAHSMTVDVDVPELEVFCHAPSVRLFPTETVIQPWVEGACHTASAVGPLMPTPWPLPSGS